MKANLILKNIKKEDISSKLTKELKSIDGVTHLKIDEVTINLSFEYKTHNALEGLRGQLKQLGFSVKDK